MIFTWSTAAYACVGLTVVSMAVLAWAFWQSPEKGFALSTHTLENLPTVMADRYVSFGLITLGAAIIGGMSMLAWVFLVGAFMGLADGWIYWRAKLKHAKHTASGLMSAVAAFVCYMAATSPA